MTLSSIPAGFWDLADSMFAKETSTHTQFIEAVSNLVDGCWRIGVAVYLHSVWRWRVNHFDENNTVTESFHKRSLNAKLMHGYNTVHLHMKAQLPRRFQQASTELLRRAMVADSTTVSWDSPLGGTPVFLLFFDGGSRGNPGPGGSGAIVIRTGTSAAGPMAVWIGSMSFASKTTTNNVAENMGLLIGLKACAARRYEPLHVIGDSAMIIRQQSSRKPPKAAHLKQLYWKSRRTASMLNIIQWHYHLRGFNKMADKLANMAMDSRRSVQVHTDGNPTELQKWEPVLRHMEGDLHHWQSTQEGAMQDGIVDNSP